MMGGCPLPSLARPSLLHRLDRKDSKIFVHPLGTRLDVCNGHTRSLSVCHLRWWTNANKPRRIPKTLYKSDAAPGLEQHIDVTRRIVGDESLTCRQHRDGWQVICARVASSTALAADALRKTAAATVYRASKNIVFSHTHVQILDHTPHRSG